MIIKQLDKTQETNKRAIIASGLVARLGVSLKNKKAVDKKWITKAVDILICGKASLNARGPTKSNCSTTKAAWVEFIISQGSN